ncbi:MAG: PAS domain-containing protein [Proteobacteria bacterium]|nr:PAS domain-containing protein [Pseudomonadota bacterium]
MVYAFESSETNTRAERATPAERRATGAALAYWDSLRGGRDCPSVEELHIDRMPDLNRNAVLIALDSDGHSAGTVAFGGEEVERLCGTRTRGRTVWECLPSGMRERTAQVLAAAAAVRRPLADSDRFSDAAGDTVLYRSVFMPLAGADGRITHLLGAFSFKSVAAA